MKLSARRAELLSLAALLLQLFFFLLTLLISSGRWTGSPAVQVEAWHFLGGAGIWLILLLQFHQRRLAEEERLDAEQYQRLHREGKDTSVFEGKMIEEELHLAGRRLVWLEKYLLAIFSVLTAVYLVAMGIWQYTRLAGPSPEEGVEAVEAIVYLARGEVLLGAAAVLVGIALVSFLFSRYAVGMSQTSEWRPLRAGGSYLLSNVLACLALAVILGFAKFGYRMPERVMSYVLAGLMVVIGVEIILSLLLDAYRPRIKGLYRRAAYESRLLGLFSEPGGILRTAAHAIDYQFGFKVSDTWFYKLIERAVVPLLLAMAISLYLLSCLSIVPPGNVGILERWGRPLNLERPYQNGMHFKLPWPVDYIRKFPVEQVQIIEVGFERYRDEDGNIIRDKRPILWTVEHWKEEYPFMVAVADKQQPTGMETESVEPVTALEADMTTNEQTTRTATEVADEQQLRDRDFDMLVLALVIHYRISDVVRYGYGRDSCYQQPHDLLEAICNRQTVHFAAQADIEQLLGPGRRQTTQDLQQKIQEKVDEDQMGVEIVFVGMEAVHPPREVAQSFEEVFGAYQDRQAVVLMAQGHAYGTLAGAQGQYDVVLAEAEAYAFERPIVEQARAQRFKQQMQAYQKGGDVYLMREFFSILDNLVPQMRKYVTAADTIGHKVFEINLEDPLKPDIFTDFSLGFPDDKENIK